MTLVCLFGKSVCMTALTAYLADKGEKISAFAVRIGRSPSTLTRVLSGERNPSIELARDIERGTGGEISAAEFLASCLDVRRELSE